MMHPATVALLRFFDTEHLRPDLADVSAPFGVLARRIAEGPANAETTVALRKLLEAKDAAVRAAL
jgi:hypothetical protein